MVNGSKLASMEPSSTRQQFPDYTRTVAVKYVRRGLAYLSRYAASLLLVPLAGSVALELVKMYQSGKMTQLWAMASETDLTFNLVTVVGCCSVLVAVLLALWLLQTRTVYLVDFSVYKCPDSWAVSKQHFKRIFEPKGFTPESIDFMDKVLKRSGIGETTYAAPTMTGNPQDLSLSAARQEFEQTAYKAIAEVFNKTGISPRQIGIVINNSSLFNTTPSLSASIMNHFKMSSSTINYNLGGMGCSAGVVAIDLARQMLQLYPNTYALVVSTENNTHNWYCGTNRSMLVTNTLFRVGASAIILSNKRSDSWRAKYVLQHVVRTNLAANDAAYQCIYEQEDEDGVKGVSLSKQLMAIAGEAIKANITTLGPLVLPLSEQLLFAGNLIARKVLGRKALKAYLPDFKQAFEHFVIHTGGRGVLDEIEKQLALPPSAIEPSRACLWRFGNVSSGSIWYVMAYIETFRGVKRGDRIWQLAFGSGFKCNSAVWKANRRFQDKHVAWEDFELSKMQADLAAMQ